MEDPRVVSMVLPLEVMVEITGMVVVGTADEEEREELVVPVAVAAAEEKSAMAARAAVPDPEACADWQYCRPYW